MEVVHQDKESIPAARQSSKINQPARVCFLYLIIREPNFYRSYKSLICPHIPRLAEAKTVTFPVGNSRKQMTASQLHHPLTKQSCIKLICCRSFICDWNNCQVPARGFRSLIKALLSEMDSCFSIVSQNLWGWKRSEEESDLTCWKQGQLWGQTRLLHVLASDVLKTFKNGDTAFPDNPRPFKGAGKGAMVHANLIY